MCKKKALVLVGEGALEQHIKGQIVFDFLFHNGAIYWVSKISNKSNSIILLSFG